MIVNSSLLSHVDCPLCAHGQLKCCTLCGGNNSPIPIQKLYQLAFAAIKADFALMGSDRQYHLHCGCGQLVSVKEYLSQPSVYILCPNCESAF